jgi:3-oxoacyl-[acyl-carrier protein] reductase
MSKEAQIALVTGASKGIGAAIAIELAAAGYDIWLNYRSDHDAARAVAARIEELGQQSLLVPFDVADEQAAAEALEPLLAEAAPGVVVNNAGFAKDTLLFWMTADDWHQVMQVHLDGFFYVVRLVLPHMLGKRQGRIINIVSTSGETGMPGQVNYSAAKAGLIGATKALAREVARRNVLVNAVSPGFIETAMTADVDPKKVLPMIPINRLGKVEEVAGVVRFLCSDAASYITGQVIGVNGGSYM